MRLDSLLFAPQRNGTQPRPDAKGKGRAVQDGDLLALDIGSAEEGIAQNGGNAFMQMQVMEQQVCTDVFLTTKAD